MGFRSRAMHPRVLVACLGVIRNRTMKTVVGRRALPPLVLAFALAACSQSPSSSVRVIKGTVTGVTPDGRAMSIGRKGYFVPNPWRGVHGSWHDSGQPECATPGSSGAKVELEVIDLPAGDHSLGYPNFSVRLRCLTLPTKVDAP